MIDFDTVTMSLRYGLTDKINLVATIPWFSIDSRKIQGAPYTRVNKGLGDLVLEAEYQFLEAPHLSISAGVKFANGSVDNADEFGQRICDILALGSGTTDFLLGGGLWVPHIAGVEHLSLFASARHRFVSGANKWGYQYGNQTTLRVRADYPVLERASVGLAVDAYRTDKDRWYGNVVPERGATFLYLGPTVAYNLSDSISLGAFVRYPVYMDLEGAQMVSPSNFGLEMTTDVSSIFQGLLSPLGVGE